VESCKNSGTASAWDEFVLRTQGLVAGTVATTIRRWKACQSASVDDVAQEVYLKISANRAAVLRNFESRHPNAIFGYLRAISSSVAQDYCKGLSAARRGGGRDQSLGDLEPADDHRQHGAAASIEQKVLLGEIEGILQRAASGQSAQRDRTIFWLYYRQGFTASSIAALPGIELNVKGVESTILRLTRRVRQVIGESRMCSATLAEPPKEDRPETSL